MVCEDMEDGGETEEILQLVSGTHLPKLQCHAQLGANPTLPPRPPHHHLQAYGTNPKYLATTQRRMDNVEEREASRCL